MFMAVIILQEKLIAKMMHIIWKLSLFLCNCLENVKRKEKKTGLEKQIVVNAKVTQLKTKKY